MVGVGEIGSVGVVLLEGVEVEVMKKNRSVLVKARWWAYGKLLRLWSEVRHCCKSSSSYGR